MILPFPPGTERRTQVRRLIFDVRPSSASPIGAWSARTIPALTLLKFSFAPRQKFEEEVYLSEYRVEPWRTEKNKEGRFLYVYLPEGSKDETLFSASSEDESDLFERLVHSSKPLPDDSIANLLASISLFDAEQVLAAIASEDGGRDLVKKAVSRLKALEYSTEENEFEAVLLAEGVE